MSDLFNSTATAYTVPQSSYVPVDPATAKQWLAGNTVNRRMRGSRVDQYARDMREGRWQLSSDAIAFSADGKLLNGQHRLNAVVESGVTIVFLVVRNMPESAMATMDAGAARTAGDAVGFTGEQNASMMAATAKQCLLYSDGRIYQDKKRGSVSNSEILAFIEAHPTVRESVRAVQAAARSMDASPSAIIAAHWIIYHANQANQPEHATRYIQQVASRVNEPAGSAVHAVDSRLKELRKATSRPEQRNIIYLFIKGWNYWARNQPVRRLAIRPKPGTPFSTPDPATYQR